MEITLKIRPEYAKLYGINVSCLPLPNVGESLRAYVIRAKLGEEADILAVVNQRAKSLDYFFADNDMVEIYPMAASG